MQLDGIYNESEGVLIIGGVSQGDLSELDLDFDAISVSESINALVVEGLMGGACVTLDNRSDEADVVRELIETSTEEDLINYLDAVIVGRLGSEELVELIHKGLSDAFNVGYAECLSDVHDKMEELRG